MQPDPNFDTNDSINPDLDELLQQEQDHNVRVPVQIDHAVRVHELPSLVAHSRNLNVAGAAAGVNPDLVESIGPEDPRRKWMFILVETNPVFIGFDKQNVADGVSGRLPVGVVLPLPAAAPIFVRSTAAGGSIVSYWAGAWAD